MARDEFPDAELRWTADILFTARLKADELRFDIAPENSVEFSEDADAASGSVRTNLPAKVEEHVTYRNVEVHYAIAAKLPMR
jgi:hypothetical protein